MNSSKSNLNNNGNGEDDNSSRDDSNLDDNNPFHVFSSSPPQPSPPPSQLPPPMQPSPPPSQPLPPSSQPSRPFWNFISPSAPSISHQLLFHSSTSTNARPLSYNNASALSLTLTNRPWNRSIGRGNIGGSSSSSSHLLNQRHHYTASPAPQPSPRRRTDQLMAASGEVPAPSQPSPFRSPPPPCTECGRRFTSSKALFGHMRCHPERTWRGINPPPNARPTAPPEDKAVRWKDFTRSELDVVEALLFLATGIEHKLERTSGTVISGEEEDNAPLVGASIEQNPAVPDLEEEGECVGVRSVVSSSSTMRYALDLNLPPPPEEDTEGSDGSYM